MPVATSHIGITKVAKDGAVVAAQPARAPRPPASSPPRALPAMPQRATRRGASRVAAIMTSATVEKAALKAMCGSRRRP